MHIKEELLTKFQDHTLDKNELTTMLEHIGTCDYCAEELAFSQQQTELMKAPDYLKGQIINRTKDLDIQASIQITQHSKEFQFFLYGLRTSVAVICALVFLSVGTHPNLIQYMKTRETIPITKEFTNKIQESSNWMANSINSLSDKLFNGGNKND